MGLVVSLISGLVRAVLSVAVGALCGALSLLAAFLLAYVGLDWVAADAPKAAERKFPALGASKQLAGKVRPTVQASAPALPSHAGHGPTAVPAGARDGGQLLLRVKAFEARDIVPTDVAKTHANAMLVLRFAGQVAKTKLVRKSLAPRWDFVTQLPVPAGVSVDQEPLLLELRSTSKLLGRAAVSLGALVRGAESPVMNVPLTGMAQTDYGLVRARGEVSLSLELVDRHVPLLALGPGSVPAGVLPAPAAALEATADAAQVSAAERERAADLRRERLLSTTVHERAKEEAARAKQLPAAARDAGERVHASFLQVDAGKEWVEYYCVLERRGVVRVQLDESPDHLVALVALAGCDVRQKSKKLAFEIKHRLKKNVLELFVESLAAPHEKRKSASSSSASAKPVYTVALRARDEADLARWLRELLLITLPAPADPLGAPTAPSAPASASASAPATAAAAGGETASATSMLQKQMADEERKLDLGGDEGGAEGPAASAMDPLRRALDGLRDVKPLEAKYGTLVLGRIFHELSDSRIFLNDIYRHVKRALKGLHYDFVGPVVVQSLDLGKRFFTVHRVRAAGPQQLGRADEMVVELEVEYPGGLQLSFTTDLFVNFPRPRAAVVPVQLHVSINYLAGKFCLYGPPNTADRYEIFFNGSPTFMPNVRVEVGDKQRQVLTSTLKGFVYTAVNKALQSVLVHPNSVAFWLPYPGKLAGPKVNMRSKHRDQHSSPPADRPLRSSGSAPGTPPPGPEAAAPPPMLARRGVTELAMEIGPSKNSDDKPETHAKKFIMARYVDEVLNRREYEALAELVTDDTVVHGFSPTLDQALVGRAALDQALRQLHRALPDSLFNLEDVAVDGDYIYARWKARGTHAAALFASQAVAVAVGGGGEEELVATGNATEAYGATAAAAGAREVLLSGFSVCRMGHGNQRLHELWHFWMLPALAAVLHTPVQAA